MAASAAAPVPSTWRCARRATAGWRSHRPQVHGIAFLGVGIAVVALAILAGVALSGVGPFRASVASVVADPPGLNVTLSVTNDGSRAGSTTCRVYDPSLGISVRSAIVQTPRIERAPRSLQPAGDSLAGPRPRGQVPRPVSQSGDGG
jgi:hypothetical protein